MYVYTHTDIIHTFIWSYHEKVNDMENAPGSLLIVSLCMYVHYKCLLNINPTWVCIFISNMAIMPALSVRINMSWSPVSLPSICYWQALSLTLTVLATDLSPLKVMALIDFRFILGQWFTYCCSQLTKYFSMFLFTTIIYSIKKTHIVNCLLINNGLIFWRLIECVTQFLQLWSHSRREFINFPNVQWKIPLILLHEAAFLNNKCAC